MGVNSVSNTRASKWGRGSSPTRILRVLLPVVVLAGMAAPFIGAGVASATVPTVTTSAANSVTATGATLNGSANPNNHNTTVTFCYSTSSSLSSCGGATSVDATPFNLTANTGSSSETATLTGLAPNTEYYFQIAANNSSGNSYGSVLNFTTAAEAPTATTNAATSVTATGATLNGSVNAEDTSTTVTFCYSTSSSLSSCVGGTVTSVTGSTSPATGDTATNETATLTGLAPNTEYYFQIKAVGFSTVYGSVLNFTTSTEAPTATLGTTTGITTTGATLNGTVNAEGTSTTVTFCYSTSSSLSSCGGATSVAATPSTATGTSPTSESATLTGLTTGTTYYFQIKAVGASTVYSSVLSFTTLAPPAITSASSTTFTVGSAGSFQATATGVPAPTFSNTAFSGCTPSTLPTGVSFSTGGLLSGTPPSGSTGSYTVCINATNGVGTTATQTFTLTINQAPAITSASSTTFTVGSAGSFQATATGVPAPTFSNTAFSGCTPSTLPTGVSFSTAGLLSGTPPSASGGAYTVCINATNGVGTTATQKFTLTINQAPAITSASSTTFTVGSAGSFQATATGVPAPTFSNTAFSGCTPSTLPTGVSFSTAGLLSGTPPSASGGAYTVCINATNGVGTTATQTFTLTINQAPAITSASSTTFTVGSAGSFQATATGVPAPTFSNTAFSGCTPSTLPTGVSFSTAGLLSGTPPSASGGAYTVCINATNGVGTTATQKFTLTINQAPAITSASSTTFTVGSAGSFQATATGVPAPTFSNTAFSGCTPSTLPTGVSFSTAGLLSGTPPSASGGAYTVCINATNGVGTTPPRPSPSPSTRPRPSRARRPRPSPLGPREASR